MARGEHWLVLFAMLLFVATPHQALSKPGLLHAKFVAANGDVIELDTGTGVLHTPRSQNNALRDCSDKFQFCLTNHRGFVFSYFRKCNDAAAGNYDRLRFPPKIASVLHNEAWIVFDAAPKYMFHYDFSKGLIGIYVGLKPSFDFQSIFRDPKFRLPEIAAIEYRIVGSVPVAACTS